MKKIIYPMKNHVRRMVFGDATHVLDFVEVDGHLEATTDDQYIIDSLNGLAIVEEV